MFPMTVTINDQIQLSAVMAALGFVETTEAPKATRKETRQAQATVAKNGASSPSSPTTSTTEAAAQEPAPESATPSASGAESVTQMSATEAVAALNGIASRPADAPTYQATAQAVTDLAKAKGRDVAVAVLKEFGAAKLPDVKPEQFADVITACAKAEA